VAAAVGRDDRFVRSVIRLLTATRHCRQDDTALRSVVRPHLWGTRRPPWQVLAPDPLTRGLTNLDPIGCTLWLQPSAAMTDLSAR
jgi:hypothetical protein